MRGPGPSACVVRDPGPSGRAVRDPGPSERAVRGPSASVRVARGPCASPGGGPGRVERAPGAARRQEPSFSFPFSPALVVMRSITSWLYVECSIRPRTPALEIIIKVRIRLGTISLVKNWNSRRKSDFTQIITGFLLSKSIDQESVWYFQILFRVWNIPQWGQKLVWKKIN